MGKLEEFEILFHNAKDTFTSGSILKGLVLIKLKEPMTIKGITITFFGNAYVRWEEGSSKRRYVYTSREAYLNHIVPLCGDFKGDSTTDLERGRHIFPFLFQLPRGIPSSFEGGTGSLRYLASCNIEKSWSSHNTTRPFIIINMLDLNQLHIATKTASGSNKKQLFCLCCKSDPIEATFHIDKIGYVPGESIKLCAEIHNRSNTTIRKTFVDLRMITMFHAKNKTRTETTEIARITRPGIQPHQEDIWDGVQFTIPNLPASFLSGCNIIDIHYILRLNVESSGSTLDLTIPLEIIIGNIPFAEAMTKWRLPVSQLNSARSSTL